MRSIEAAPGAGAEFVSEADWIPGFWNFLLGLDAADLIPELVQNDLDQQATRTIISFERDRLICEGNGAPVDPDGWRRLRMISGAGHSVPAKVGKIGVKNYGLKAAFTVGDEVQLLSDGQSITQTLYADGADRPPRPGASKEPSSDSGAPEIGCRVIVSYRRRACEPTVGERLTLPAPQDAEIDQLSSSACAGLPQQFAGIVAPGVQPYEIRLRHWRLGEAIFRFRCTRPHSIGRRIEVFRRRCDVSGDFEPLPLGFEEEVARRLLPLQGKVRERMPDFFRRDRRFFIDVSWPIASHGRPRIDEGRYRYPIGYPVSSQTAQTGHGASFSAPFLSDQERHGPAWHDPTNNTLLEACEDLFADVVARRLTPKWGAAALRPLLPPDGSEEAMAITRRLLVALVERNGLPTLSWEGSAQVLQKGLKRPDISILRRLHRGPRVGPRYRFVVPVLTSQERAVHPSLALVCPVNESQIDPRLDARILELLADPNTPGFGESFVTFDENDAISYMTSGASTYFPATIERETECSDPLLARAYLDVVSATLGEKAKGQNLQASLLLPDSHRQATRFQDLHASASLPSSIPGLRLPPLLHPDLALHPLFKKTAWKLPHYTLEKFLEGDSLEHEDEETRRQLWQWLRTHEEDVPARARTRLVSLPLWPDTTGRLRSLPDLCEPRSARVARLLAPAIHRPHKQVLSSKLAGGARTGPRALRRVPTPEELSAWLESQLAALEEGPADDEAAARLKRFEENVASLLGERSIAELVRQLDLELPALAQDGSIRMRSDLVLPSESVARLALPSRMLLAQSRSTRAVQRLCSALTAPTAAMLETALQEDGSNFDALQARLLAVLRRTSPGDATRRRLADLPFIPVDGSALAPSALALRGTKGDYWGNWKLSIRTQDLPQDAQVRYREIGVTASTPNPDTSRAFFTWLSEQSESVLRSHVVCVMRHLLHEHGPREWAKEFPDLRVVPTEGLGGLRLASVREVSARAVYLSDQTQLAEKVRAADARVWFAIAGVRGVSEPATDVLRELGVRSLREAAGDAQHAVGQDNLQSPSPRLLDYLKRLKSSRLRSTLTKRLVALGVDRGLIWHDWHDRLSKVGGINLAERVEATYRFHGRLYRLAVDVELDPETQVLWLKDGGGDLARTFFEGIAARCILKPSAQPMHLFALQPAVELETKDPYYGKPAASTDTEPEVEDDVQEEEAGETGESIFGHAPFEPDPSRNRPQPGPILSGDGATSPARSKRDGSGAGGRSEGRRSSPEEKQQVEALKTEHYASHCQMCLAKRGPTELAPHGSYVEWEEVRRAVIEAHHLDPVAGSGALHVGNIVLLCKLHHDNFGRRLTRMAVLEALQAPGIRKVIRFDPDDEQSAIEGRVVDLVLPDTGEEASLFFTDTHARYWLERGSELDKGERTAAATTAT